MSRRPGSGRPPARGPFAAAARASGLVARVGTLLVTSLASTAGAQSVQGTPGPTPARAPWADPSPHRARLIRVAPDVQLEVLDWGGPASGASAGGGARPPLVFLAGSGNSAHVFDGFAPRFTSRVRVLGISRRGVGASSRPASGYNTATLARDVVAVLDTLGIPKATFAAHSFGGSELHALGADHAGRVAGLVYLDAAYDYHALVNSPEDRSGALQTPEPPLARYWDDTVGSWTLLAERMSGPAYPEAEVRTLFVFDGAGRWVRRATADSLRAWYDRGVERVDLRRVRVPVLAVYAVPGSAETMFPYWAALDRAGRARGARSYAGVTALLGRLRARFRADVPGARVVVIPGARHYVFLTHPGETEHAMLEFLLPPRAAR